MKAHDVHPDVQARLRHLEAALATERDRAASLERELARSEERFRQVTDTIDQVFWMTDPEKGQMLMISKGYERIWGASVQSLLDNPSSFVDAIHAEDRQRVIEAFPLQTQGTYDIEYRVVSRLDGKIRWVRDRAYPVAHESGTVHLVVGIVDDITERRRMLDEIQEAQSRFHQVTDHIDQVFWMTDPAKAQMLFISKAYESLWGRSLRSLRDDPASFVQAIHPDDRQRVLEAFPLQSQGRYDIEYRVISRSDGRTRWVRDRAFQVRDANGVVSRVVGTVSDITEQKRLWEELKVERDRAEGLLRNILPAAIVDELQRREHRLETREVMGKRIDCASVLFADIVGFTELAARQDASAVVNLLNDLFSVFDHLVGDFGVEKIKTIGDSYMLAGGVPDEDPRHALAVADIALEMLDQVRLFNERTHQSLKLRIGVHAGPLLAGVIGTKKFIFDIWGDTVNVASRMESHGIPGSIHVTQDFYDLTREAFSYEPRGEIQVKGKGLVNTYLLRSRRHPA